MLSFELTAYVLYNNYQNYHKLALFKVLYLKSIHRHVLSSEWCIVCYNLSLSGININGNVKEHCLNCLCT